MEEKNAFQKIDKLHKNDTAALMEEMEKKNNFEEFEKAFADDFLPENKQVGDYLAMLLNQYDQKATVVSELAGLNRSYVGNILNGYKNNPSRDVLICICFVIGTTREEAEKLLKYAGYAPLYARSRRDMIISFGFQNHKQLADVNADLIAKGHPGLYNEN